jgi:hypothetical protein
MEYPARQNNAIVAGLCLWQVCPQISQMRTDFIFAICDNPRHLRTK